MSAKKFDEISVGEVLEAGPLLLSDSELNVILKITGEKHPIHEAEKVIPAGILHSVVAGALVTAGGSWDVVGLKTMTWRFMSAIKTEQQFMVRGEVLRCIEVDDSVGIVTVRRTLTTTAGVCAVGEIVIAVAR